MKEKLIYVFVFLFSLLIFIPVKASSYDYEIKSYDINIVVSEDNIFDIEETIEAYFNVPKHGIIRNIPLKNNVKREDGSQNTTRARVKKLYVNSEYTTSYVNNDYSIKIGEEDVTLTGLQKYTIKYKYDLSNDKNNNFDELYFNIIGDKWDTEIDNITFRIYMPKDFDESQIGFSAGSYGSGGTNLVSYSLDGNAIIGKYNGKLNPNEALTIRCELPEGYFLIKKYDWPIPKAAYIIIPILFVIVGYMIWKKYGKDDIVIETVEFYPPNNLNSLDLSFAYKGRANTQDVTSLLIYLASKGYIKIAEGRKRDFILTKIKDYDGDNEEEKIFFEGLFSSGNTITKKDLKNKFYTTVNRILMNVNSRKNKNVYFDKKASNKTIIFVLMIISVYLIITIPPLYFYCDAALIAVGIIFSLMGFFIMFISLFLLFDFSSKKYKLFSLLVGIIFGGFLGGLSLVTDVLPALLEEIVFLYIYIIGFICFALLILILCYIPKRTEYGNEILGKIRGFKRFLKTAEKDKLESLVSEEPEYFYNILPYTYVLGISDTWIKKFETISIPAPEWYESDRAFNVMLFNDFINDTMKNASNAMTSAPSSDGGGYSGGGFSGGGSGGGGGSSW